MAFNSNFDILEPSSWNALLLANDFAVRPTLNTANTSIAGVNIQGQVASKNKTVKIAKAGKLSGDARTYTGSGYTPDTPTVSQPELTMDTVYYRQFPIDKWDANFALPDLVSMHIRPYMENVLDTIEANKAKSELNKFNTVVADLNTNPTVMDTEDIRFMRKALLKRGLVNPSAIKAAVIDPDGEFDLNGLSLFNEADKRGSNVIQLTGAMGVAFGFNFLLGHNTESVSTDAATGNAVVAAAASIGDTTVTIDNGSGAASDTTLADGDIIYFGSSPTRDDFYVVDSVNTAKTEITLKESLRAAVANNAAITGIAGDCQYFYDTESLAVVTAIPAASQVLSASGVTRIPFYEPMNKVNFLISIEGDTSGGTVTVETLVGAKNFYPSRGGRYIRGTTAKA